MLGKTPNDDVPPNLSSNYTAREVDKEAEIGVLPPSITYSNAKVVLLGNSGAGKSGLCRVLLGNAFMPDEPTSYCTIHPFEDHPDSVDIHGNLRVHKTLLWDLVGRADHRFINQFYLRDASVVILVIDSCEVEPLETIYQWNYALHVTQERNGISTKAKKFLVLTHMDRGMLSRDSYEQIKDAAQKFRFDKFYATSAKDEINIVKWGNEIKIAELGTAIKEAVNWPLLSNAVSYVLMQDIRAFITIQKETGHVLQKEEEFFQSFINQLNEQSTKWTQEHHEAFTMCLKQLEVEGEIYCIKTKPLDANSPIFILLQTALLTEYTLALIREAKDEPDGLGCIEYHKALQGRFPLKHEDVRIKDPEQQEIFLKALVDYLRDYKVTLLTPTEDGQYLVFPSLSKAENQELSSVEEEAVIFHINGPIMHLYHTIAVRLSHHEVYKKQTSWKNTAMTFLSSEGELCGMSMHRINEDHGTLTLFFNKATSKGARDEFELYVHAYLKRNTEAKIIYEEHTLFCSNPECRFPFTEKQIKKRLFKGYDFFDCDCDTKILIDENHKKAYPAQFTQQMQSLEDRKTEEDYDVFFGWSGKAEDQYETMLIYDTLRQKGFHPWIQQLDLSPGSLTLVDCQNEIGKMNVMIAFLSRSGVSNEQEMYINAALNKGCYVIPAILSNTPLDVSLPSYLSSRYEVDFRVWHTHPLDRLVRIIKRKRDDRR